jgi:quercetin dioxygenase-like cupin family protein
MKINRTRLQSGVTLALMLSGALLAQNSGVQRTVVERHDVPAGKEAIVARVEFAPGASVGRHTHFGEEISYVIEGEGDLIIQGQPVRHVKAGDGFVVPAGAIHDAHNTGAQPMKLAVVYYVDKGKPLATPAP